MKTLLCYATDPQPLEMVPARPTRDWMDATSDRFAYRCLPLNMANSTGWELLSPCDFDVTWTGGLSAKDLVVRALDGYDIARLAVSHFAYGVLTFHTGWLFRTPPGWALIATGAPNWPRDGITPLTGLIETDWLPFSFTMNWQMTRPGRVTFRKGEPVCFVMPVMHAAMDGIQPVQLPLEANPELKKQYDNWAHSRGEFIEKLERNDPETIKKSWQRFYMHGKDAEGVKTGNMHLSRRQMLVPRPGTPADETAAATERTLLTTQP